MAEAPLRLRFADGTELSFHAGARNTRPWLVLRGHAAPYTIFHSRRVFDMFVEFDDRHAGRSLGDDPDPAVDAWDRGFMARVDDTDILHDLFVASAELQQFELLNLCGQKTVDLIRGRTVEEVKTQLGIVGVTEEQDLQAQLYHDRLLR